MTADLRAAFLAASYGTAGERFRLSAGRGPAPPWAGTTWAVVTAWNPGAGAASPAANARASAALLRDVRAAGCLPLMALNGEGEWAEEALLVPGARLRQAADWGAAFGQRAVLWAVGARVALVWLSGARVTRVERFWAVSSGSSGPAAAWP